MMAQYRRIKSELPPGTLLLFRLGDFYEMFMDDAKVGAQLLNVALTKRGDVPMCGIPYHAANGYIGRLLRAGRRVAICDQIEEARPGKLVKREVTQILSPGAHFDERMLAAERNNYLGAVTAAGGVYGLAVLDLTTGEFKATEVRGEAALLAELERLRPAELILPAGQTELRRLLQPAFSLINDHEDWVFTPEQGEFALREHLGVATLDGFGLRGHPAAVGAAGAVVHYLRQELRRELRHVTGLQYYETTDHLILDAATLRNLEVLQPLHRDSPRQACLYGAVNRTVTPMGARRLRDWLARPLADIAAIRARQDAIQTWLEHPAELDAFREALAEVRDLERTLGRLSAGSGGPRDLLALRIALEQVPGLRERLERLPPPAPAVRETTLFEEQPPGEGAAGPAAGGEGAGLLARLAAQLHPLPELVDLLNRGLVDEPPAVLRDGGVIRDGFDPELDELRRASREGKDWIVRLQQQEIERTGIASLKIRFNSVFGYFIEVTKANLDKVPADYVRKQTIANGERYITPALKEMEAKILGAEERAVKLEQELFHRLREEVLGRLKAIQETARALGELDVLAGWAETARLHDYRPPEVGDEGRLIIREGRHPVLEQTMVDQRFVPNDTDMAVDGCQIMLITGPNMAGKSTYIRQVALLALLAHAGCYIPAASARIDLLDRIFTRIGASDDLARGQSTFMVEMSETANILHHATRRSLIILDEVGRGTSTFDGLSLAWSIVEHLHNQVGALTLFATHYHELTELAGRLPRVANFNVAVREWNDQIVFLHKIVEGGADKSYGLQVARLAGVPKPVIERAKVILANLEQAELTPEGKPRRLRRHRAERETLRELEPPEQLDLFG
ncbi:MAG: DNA mismatch repair protein MutS [Verrucomicrobia bacterium]|nr:MAG: DNA mismatch repair protein MutS [Verrucomicrobiota bacterium]